MYKKTLFVKKKLIFHLLCLKTLYFCSGFFRLMGFSGKNHLKHFLFYEQCSEGDSCKRGKSV